MRGPIVNNNNPDFGRDPSAADIFVKNTISDLDAYALGHPRIPEFLLKDDDYFVHHGLNLWLLSLITIGVVAGISLIRSILKLRGFDRHKTIKEILDDLNPLAEITIEENLIEAGLSVAIPRKQCNIISDALIRDPDDNYKLKYAVIFEEIDLQAKSKANRDPKSRHYRVGMRDFDPKDQSVFDKEGIEGIRKDYLKKLYSDVAKSGPKPSPWKIAKKFTYDAIHFAFEIALSYWILWGLVSGITGVAITGGIVFGSPLIAFLVPLGLVVGYHAFNYIRWARKGRPSAAAPQVISLFEDLVKIRLANKKRQDDKLVSLPENTLSEVKNLLKSGESAEAEERLVAKGLAEVEGLTESNAKLKAILSDEDFAAVEAILAANGLSELKKLIARNEFAKIKELLVAKELAKESEEARSALKDELRKNPKLAKILTKDPVAESIAFVKNKKRIRLSIFMNFATYFIIFALISWPLTDLLGVFGVSAAALFASGSIISAAALIVAPLGIAFIVALFFAYDHAVKIKERENTHDYSTDGNGKFNDSKLEALRSKLKDLALVVHFRRAKLEKLATEMGDPTIIDELNNSLSVDNREFMERLSVETRTASQRFRTRLRKFFNRLTNIYSGLSSGGLIVRVLVSMCLGLSSISVIAGFSLMTPLVIVPLVATMIVFSALGYIAFINLRKMRRATELLDQTSSAINSYTHENDFLKAKIAQLELALSVAKRDEAEIAYAAAQAEVIITLPGVTPTARSGLKLKALDRAVDEAIKQADAFRVPQADRVTLQQEGARSGTLFARVKPAASSDSSEGDDGSDTEGAALLSSRG